MTDTTETTVETPTRGHAAPAAVPALTAVALDIAYGDRDADRCGNCGRHLPALPIARLELELPDGTVLCANCGEKAHRGLRLVLAVFNHVLEAEAAGDTKAATETLQGIVSAFELTADRTLIPPTPSPNRQARRHTAKPSRGRRRR
jgi:hypothetical protein